MLRLIGVALTGLLALSATLSAQIGTQGAILGVVTDQTGAAVPAAEVRVQHLETGLTRSVITDGSGNFEILALPIGFYSVSVSQTGFKIWRLERLQITTGERRAQPHLTGSRSRRNHRAGHG